MTAVMTASLAVGVAMAGAAAAPKAMKLTCHISMATIPPPGSNTVNQPPSQGLQYGPLRCGTSGCGHGIVSNSFTVPDSGDTVGKYTQYFNAGSITGSFDITPQESVGISLNSFSSQTWLGTIKIKSGTGVFSLIKEKKGTGVLKCTSVDSVHLSCVEKIKLTAV
jgi:hypothetical protein